MAEPEPESELQVPCTPQQMRALSLAALAALVAVIWLARPVGVGLLLGTLTAFTVQPFYYRLRQRWHGSELAAAVVVAMVSLGFIALVVGLAYFLVVRGAPMAQALVASLGPGGSLRGLLGRMAHRLALLQLTEEEISARLTQIATELTARAAALAAAIAGTTMGLLLTLVFFVLSMHYILRNWNRLAQRAEMVLPLHPRHTHELLGQFRRVGRSVLMGTVLTGLAQGLLAAIGYRMTGISEAVFFGALTAMASLIPAVGTVLVWLPMGVYLMMTGHVAWGIVELLWGGLVVVGLCDYLLRPALVGSEGDLPVVLTLVALFGGLEVFGLIGLIVGPVIMALALALLRTYEKERLLVAASVPVIPSSPAPLPEGEGGGAGRSSSQR
jgi:predicted PurR-regulated permease PerM